MSDDALTVPSEVQIDLVDDGKVTTRDPESEIAEILDRVAADYAKTLEAAQHAFDEEEELRQLPKRVQRIARAARLPRKEVPYALEMAGQWHSAREKRKSVERGKTGVNIRVENAAMAILPPPQEKPAIDAVVVIDANDLKDKKEES